MKTTMWVVAVLYSSKQGEALWQGPFAAGSVEEARGLGFQYVMDDLEGNYVLLISAYDTGKIVEPEKCPSEAKKKS